jgi:hypothetical protein
VEGGWLARRRVVTWRADEAAGAPPQPRGAGKTGGAIEPRRLRSDRGQTCGASPAASFPLSSPFPASRAPVPTPAHELPDKPLAVTLSYGGGGEAPGDGAG